MKRIASLAVMATALPLLAFGPAARVARGRSVQGDPHLLTCEVLDRLGRIDEARDTFDPADALLRG